MNNAQPYKKRRHSVSDLYLFAVFGIFAVFSLLIVILGAKVFQRVSVTTDMNNEVRSSLFYIVNKVRSADQTNNIKIEEKNGFSLLILGGAENEYETYIYYYDGSIRELMNKKNTVFDPNLGDSIVKIKNFMVEKNGNLMILSVTASDDKTYDMHIYLQSRQ